MNTERSFLGVITIFVSEFEAFWLSEIDLVGGDCELAPDRAPDLDIDLGSVKRGLVRHFNVVNPGTLKDLAHHLFGLQPELGFVDEFLPELLPLVGRETHHVFLNPEELEIVEIHLVNSIELALELLWRAIDVGIIHLQRTHAHEAEKLAALFVTMAKAILSEAKRKIAITSRQRRIQFVMM